jgi:anti-anti-sigma regulatory factor
MYFSRHEHTGFPTLTVHGSISGPYWRDFVHELKGFASTASQRLGLDLSKVTRIGAPEVQYLMDLRNRLQRAGRTLSIVALSPAAIEAIGQACVPRS